MKLKVNNKILSGLIIIGIMALNSCSIPSTAVAIIVDTKGNPLPHQGVAINVLQGATTVKTATTDATGAASLPCKYSVYPVTVTGSDGGAHKYSSVILNGDATPGAKINITESPTIAVIKVP